MPYNLQIIRAGDFVRLDGKGKLDLKATTNVLIDLAQACDSSGVDCALIDVRQATGDALTLSDLYHLTLVFRDLGFRKRHRLALLHSHRPGHKAEFFAMCSADQGWNVRAFDEYEDAINWFSESQPVD